jgi:hypothetical protein
MSIAWQKDENDNNDETQHFSLNFQVNQKIKAAVSGGGVALVSRYMLGIQHLFFPRSSEQ